MSNARLPRPVLPAGMATRATTRVIDRAAATASPRSGQPGYGDYGDYGRGRPARRGRLRPRRPAAQPEPRPGYPEQGGYEQPGYRGRSRLRPPGLRPAGDYTQYAERRRRWYGPGGGTPLPAPGTPNPAGTTTSTAKPAVATARGRRWLRRLRPAGRLPARRDRVTLQLDDGSGRTYQLREGANVIGRGQDAQFRLPDTGVSRRHLEIRWDGQVALLSDLNSTNGTTVNNAPVQEWQLADGDVIRLGHSEIVVRIH